MSALAEARNRIAAANRRNKTKQMEGAVVRHGSAVLTAAVLGSLNRAGVPIAIGPFPWKLALMGLAVVGEAISRGNTQAALSGVAIATEAVYIERSVSTNTLVAGGETEDDDDDDDDGSEL